MARTVKTLSLVWSVAAACLAATGCTDDGGAAIVAGELRHDSGIEFTHDYLILRAVPDNVDGFAAWRPYVGELDFSLNCPVDHIDFPIDFMLVGDQDNVDRSAAPNWRLLVWESDDPSSIWVEPGQAYGTVAFEFREDPYSGSWARVDIGIDQVASEQ